MKVQINTPSRIHVTLIDMNGSLGRVDGGLGFSLSNPNWIITFEHKESAGLDVVMSDDVDCSMVSGLVAELLPRLHLPPDPAIRIKIEASIQQHVGLGSKTQLSIALIDGLSRLFHAGTMTLNPQEMARLVKRGGTSGIGVNAYFSGGFIVDGGHKFGLGQEKECFSPSSASNASPGPLLFHQDFPEDWHVVCALPSTEKGAHGEGEVDIFHKFCPVPVNEVQELSHVILMRMLPGLKTNNFNDVCWCINKIQTIGFKKVELGIRGPAFRKVMKSWQESGAPCVGMSSFGPCMYSLAENENDAQEILKSICTILPPANGIAFIAKACNRGATVKVS